MEVEEMSIQELNMKKHSFHIKANPSLSRLVLKHAATPLVTFKTIVIHQGLTGWPCFLLVVAPHKANSYWKPLVSQWIWGIYLSRAPHSHCNLCHKPFSRPITLHREQESHCANILCPPCWTRIYCREYLLQRSGKRVATVHVIFLSFSIVSIVQILCFKIYLRWVILSVVYSEYWCNV